MTVHDFSFADHANDFDRHIRDSIRGLHDLRGMCTGLSRNFIQNDANVIDLGCSTGVQLWSIREANQASRPRANYIGIDRERKYAGQWRERRASNLRFEVGDVLSFNFENASLVTSLFTMQFVIPLQERVPLLQRIHDGLIDGGALIIAEKVHANSGVFEQMLTFDYYDFKRQSGFSAEEILDKQQSLRGQMVLWEETTLMSALHEAGFHPRWVQRFWQNYLFLALIAMKGASRPRPSIVLPPPPPRLMPVRDIQFKPSSRITSILNHNREKD
jgi:tRNA (cmo5U34)-methyltransferase